MTADSPVRSADLALITRRGLDTFPFRRELSLCPLIDFWHGDGQNEELDLEELQGVHGLRALRVTVDMKNARADVFPAAAVLATRG